MVSPRAGSRAEQDHIFACPPGRVAVIRSLYRTPSSRASLHTSFYPIVVAAGLAIMLHVFEPGALEASIESRSPAAGSVAETNLAIEAFRKEDFEEALRHLGAARRAADRIPDDKVMRTDGGGVCTKWTLTRHQRSVYALLAPMARYESGSEMQAQKAYDNAFEPPALMLDPGREPSSDMMACDEFFPGLADARVGFTKFYSKNSEAWAHRYRDALAENALREQLDGE